MCSGSVCVGCQGCKNENGTSSGGSETESGDLNGDESETWKGPEKEWDIPNKQKLTRFSCKKWLHDVQLLYKLTWIWSGIGILIQTVWMLGKGWESQTCSQSWVGQDCPAPIWMTSGIPNIKAVCYNIYKTNVHKAADLHTHTTYIFAEIKTFTLIKLWKKVLEWQIISWKKKVNSIIDTFTKTTKSSQVLVMLVLQPNHHSKATSMQMITKKRLERHLDFQFQKSQILHLLNLRTHSFFSFQNTLFLSLGHFILRSSFVQFSSPFHFFTPIWNLVSFFCFRHITRACFYLTDLPFFSPLPT